MVSEQGNNNNHHNPFVTNLALRLSNELNYQTNIRFKTKSKT